MLGFTPIYICFLCRIKQLLFILEAGSFPINIEFTKAIQYKPNQGLEKENKVLPWEPLLDLYDLTH